jgi:ribosomal protein L7/L12
VGWLLLNRGLRPQPAPQPLITLPPDLHSAAANDYEVLDSLTRGNKINAIKRVRTLTGLGLKEAKEFVEALERGDVVVPDGTPLNMNPAPQDRIEPFYDPEVQAHLAKGMKINAIKRVREITGLGLKEAKDLVDSWATR